MDRRDEYSMLFFNIQVQQRLYFKWDQSQITVSSPFPLLALAHHKASFYCVDVNGFSAKLHIDILETTASGLYTVIQFQVRTNLGPAEKGTKA